MNALQRLRDGYHAPVPTERLQLVRAGLGAYSFIALAARAGHWLRPASYPADAFAPVGVVSLLDSPLPAPVVYLAWALTTVLAGAFAAGYGGRWVGLAFAPLLLWVTSYRHSWGMVFHTDNLWVIHVLLLSLANAGGRRGAPLRSQDVAGNDHRNTASGWVLRAWGWTTVASYVVAAVAKLEASGLSWALGEVLREQIAYDAVRKIELGSLHSPIGPWLLPHGWLFTPLASFSLAVELLAPLALLGGRFAGVWCASAWLFHAGVLALMAIAFPYPLSGCAFLAFVPLERWRELPGASRLRTSR